jgi:hypothetical protein
MMVLVRKNELACREDWDGGLWEPREITDPIPFSKAPRLVAELSSDHHLGEQYTDRVTSVGVAPAARPAPEPGRLVARGDDRLTSNPAAQEPAPRAIPPIERPAATHRSPQAAPSLRRDLWTGPESLTARDQRLSSSRPPVRDERTSTPRSGERDEPTRNQTNRPVEPSNRVVPQISRPSPLRQEDVSLSRSWGAPSSYPEDRIRPVTPRVSDIVPRQIEQPNRSIVPPRRSEAQPSSATNVNNPTPRSRPSDPSFGQSRDNRSRQFGVPSADHAPSRSQPADPPLPEGRSGWTEPFETAGRTANGPTHPSAQAPAESVPAARSNGVPVKFSPSPKQAAIPQCCGTCRDFRPAEGGERGWCNNQFAFDHRRMVQRSELACRSTIGNWWIPSDDWWQQQADISHHGRPTPVVDDLLRQLLDARSNGTNQRNNGRS